MMVATVLVVVIMAQAAVVVQVPQDKMVLFQRLALEAQARLLPPRLVISF